MGDRTTITIITESREDKLNVGISVYIHHGGRACVDAALEATRPYVEGTMGAEFATLREQPERLTTAIVHKLYESGNYAEPWNVYLTQVAGTRENIIAFAQGDDHASVTIDIPNSLIVVRDEVEETNYGIAWGNMDKIYRVVDAVEKKHQYFDNRA